MLVVVPTTCLSNPEAGHCLRHHLRRPPSTIVTTAAAIVATAPRTRIQTVVARAERDHLRCVSLKRRIFRFDLELDVERLVSVVGRVVDSADIEAGGREIIVGRDRDFRGETVASDPSLTLARTVTESVRGAKSSMTIDTLPEASPTSEPLAEIRAPPPLIWPDDSAA